ncbi:hypothetical protein BH09BAC4_BH09BAC4_49880 [soil metagenome]
MQFLAYIVFVITVLFFIGLALLTVSEPSRGGDSAMGNGWGVIYVSLGFAVSSLLLLLIVRSTGGYNWVAQKAGTRTLLLLVFWLSMSITTLFGAILKLESHKEATSPLFIQVLAGGQLQLWIPLLWLIVCLLSLNPGWLSTVSLQWFKLPFWVGFSMSTLFTAGLVVVYIHDSIQRTTAQAATHINDETRWHQARLDQVAAHKPEDSILGFLAFTTRYQADDVRQAALTKIKAYPDWEALLLDLLANKYYYQEVYSFLGSNQVAHPEAFIQPLNQSIELLSDDILAEIKGGYNLQNWSFNSYGIDNLLHAVDEQFSGQIAAFYPNVLKVKQALNTPLPYAERDKDVRFEAIGVVDTWLKTHKITFSCSIQTV